MDNNISDIMNKIEKVLILSDQINIEKLPVDLQFEHFRLNVEFINDLIAFTNNMESLIVKASNMGALKDEANNKK